LPVLYTFAGTGVGDISGETEPEYWFAYNDDLNNVSTYGRLYTWYTVTDSRKVCPDGWHLPSDEEWKELEMYLGMSQAEADSEGWRGTDEGVKLKETGTTHWDIPNTGANNQSGFTALPGGSRSDNGPFASIGNHGCWWSSTEYNTDYAWGRYVYYYDNNVCRNQFNKKDGYSIRCIKD